MLFNSRAEDRTDALSLDRKGTLTYTCYLPKQFDEGYQVRVLMVELQQLAKEIYAILDLAERLYSAACDYRGAIFVGAILTNIGKVALYSVPSQLRISSPPRWEWKDQFELGYRYDKTEVTRRFLQSLLRQLQYEKAEELADDALTTAGIGLQKAKR